MGDLQRNRLFEVAGTAVGRSALVSQLLLTASTLLLAVIAAVVMPEMLSNTLFFSAMILIFVTTGLAAAVPWARLPLVWITVLPVLAIASIVLMREAEPLLGATFLLIFPVIWLSSNFGVSGAIGGVVLAAGLVWGSALNREIALQEVEIPRLAIVPIVLTFVAATTYGTTRRAAAQRALLTQQTGLFELALHRSRRQEQTLDEILNAVDFGVISFNRAGDSHLVNRAQREILARFGPRNDVPMPAVLYREDAVTQFEDDDRPFRRALRGETIDRVTVWMGAPGGDRAAFLVSARPLTDHEGVFDGSVIVLRDVTVEMRAIQARDDLVSSVSHELRTPLTSVLGYLELALDDERLDPSTRHMLTVAEKNADRLLALVSGLLTATNDTSNVFTLTVETCDLGAIVEDAVESIRPLAQERNITFEQSESEPISMKVDPFRIRQVVDNLLSNAVKYNVHSGRIGVAVQLTAGVVEVRVSDTGNGMTAAEQTRLFERFYRADSVRGSSVHGTGLGLSLSRDIMRQHGGDLRLTSEPGRGTTAIATLPVTGVQPLAEMGEPRAT
ncbi:sensor histidine kinase [Glaciibacter psychrotolerans]|uniref:histidine kinase n=1 Tax=Glaciibacter psychrotolerans TaxID=670054 RepID=A0A7Z0EEY1_9MICO|nr:sensor histidine kinase [Leifsonia psychrotolerans]NYJ20412.1 signal transduction histidine kinase [Leifsonia psychrotolerans]